MRAFPYGETGIYVDLEIEPSKDRARATHAAVRALRARLPGADVVAGAGVVAIFQVGAWDSLDEVIAFAARAAMHPDDPPDDEPPLVIPAIYDGPDLDDVARSTGLTASEVIARHSRAIYRIELLGFLPGFAYLGPVDDVLALPRRATPRRAVPAGSIGLAGGFTGVYPQVSPGGWHLLGRALDLAPFQPGNQQSAGLRAGRLVQFVPTTSSIAERSPEVPSERPPSPSRGLVIERAPACATVQDAGRDGLLGDGLPPSGPLDVAAFVAANLAVGNSSRAAAIEIPQGSLSVCARSDLVISIDGAPPTKLGDGESFTVPSCARAVRYLAVAGGIDVPLVLTSRSTLVSAHLGGFLGRPLRRGDIVPVSSRELSSRPSAAQIPFDPETPAILIVDPGPHLGTFPDDAIDHLLSTPYRVSRIGDRLGVRLEGAPLPHAPSRLHLPVPMVRGAIEITPDGFPIVLGPDHPTTGGYPVLAVVRRASQSLLARLPPGHELRFVLG